MGGAYFLTISDCDFDNDGIISYADLQIVISAGESGYWTIVGLDPSGNPIWGWIDPPPYNRRYDTNFDGVIDDTDAFYVSALWEKSANIDDIRDALKKDAAGNIKYASLNWGTVQAYLVALNISDKVPSLGNYYSANLGNFVGTYQAGREGWISLLWHPYLGTELPPGEFYVCAHFATDTMLASYKILGYGCLLKAYNLTAAGLGSHAYCIFWVGGDWTDLNNWWIVEPMNGVMFSATKDGLSETYWTRRIYFPLYLGGDGHIYGAVLDVDYATKRVSYSDETNRRHYLWGNEEETSPTTFDITLGVPITTIAPTVATQEDTNVQATTARLNGQVSDDGGEACQYRFRYKKSGGAYTYTSWTGAKTTGETFYEDISGLDEKILHYFNAQTKNSIGESAWGGELSFTTLVAIPTVITQSATLIEETSAMGRGYIMFTGGEDCDLRGVKWGTTSGYYTNNALASGSFGTGSFTRLMTPLTADTTYYYRALAHNSAGWGYGNEQIFFTATGVTAKTASDVGSGAENILDRDIFKADVGGGIESISGRAVVRAESGSGVESYKRRREGEVSSLTASYSRDEVGSALDASREIYASHIAHLRADSGSGVESYKRRIEGEASSLIAVYARSDTGFGTDAYSPPSLSSAETGSGADALFARLIKAIDTGSALDARTYFLPIGLTLKAHSPSLTLKSHSWQLSLKEHSPNLTLQEHTSALTLREHRSNLTLEEG